ncbi:hypothetical protein QR78_25670 [Methylobacterium indicum]|uniref:Uncharacterized protein n=2 Tax=Methylobacterium indicum TaxID=1775910 RepID=A0ABR5H7Q1_9HYPH|nr:hypothetical protein QR78_25670 [Methylobacterium indicum]KMO20523.1 hypothetical protein QR79_17940 [Methylobacterium indicum]
MDLAAKTLLDLIALYDVYEHARNGLAMSTSRGFGRSCEIMVTDEGERLGSVREAIYDELKRRNPADVYEAEQRGTCLVRFAADCCEWDEVAEIAAETKAWLHRLSMEAAA